MSVGSRGAGSGPRQVGLAIALGVLIAAGPVVAAERWGWFGIRIRDLSETEMEDLTVKLGLLEGAGVVVSEILKDAPAAESGLRAGDMIVAIDGRPVVETRGLQRIVGSSPPGRELAVVVLRDGRRRDLRVRVGQMPPDAVAERVAAEFGFLVRDASANDGLTDSGILPPVVTAVAERSAADRGGLRVGDRILAVNGVEVASVEAFRRRAVELSLRDGLRLGILRKGERQDLVLPPAQPVSPLN
jgi:serine protease Do